MRVPFADRSATYTLPCHDHLRKASRLPSAVSLRLSMQKPAQLGNRFAFSFGLPVVGSIGVDQKLQLSPADPRSLSPEIKRPSGDQLQSEVPPSTTVIS